MSKLNHKNIVKFVELLATKKSLFIVTEMCRSGDLKNLISCKNIDELIVVTILLMSVCIYTFIFDISIYLLLLIKIFLHLLQILFVLPF